MFPDTENWAPTGWVAANRRPAARSVLQPTPIPESSRTGWAKHSPDYLLSLICSRGIPRITKAASIVWQQSNLIQVHEFVEPGLIAEILCPH